MATAASMLTPAQRHALIEAVRYIDMLAEEGEDPGAGSGLDCLFAPDVIGLLQDAFEIKWSGPLGFTAAVRAAIGGPA